MMLISVVTWYLSLTAVGLLIFPLTYRLLPSLPDRGYSISRVLGLMLGGYIFWLLASLGILKNDITGILFSITVLAIMSVWAFRIIDQAQLREWWQSRRGMIVIAELLFITAFAGWAIVRSYSPEAIGTEKPMELAFINAILKSPSFPPRDPWLSGYGISYYYFGYVIVAMLAKLTSTPGGVAFNLGVSMVFALSALGAYGLVFNLLSSLRQNQREESLPNSTSQFLALFGPLFVLIVSNLEGFLHALHNRGLFWRQVSGDLVSPFWQWLDIKDLNIPPVEPFSWVPDRFWWWWRASRVLQDYDLAGGPKEIIDEFPFFSYLLADLHPHVLAMPFAFLAISLALNLILGGGTGSVSWFNWRPQKRMISRAGVFCVAFGTGFLVIGSLLSSILLVALSVLLLTIGAGSVFVVRKELIQNGLRSMMRSGEGEVVIGRQLHINPTTYLSSAIVLGGMFFLNAWDFPVYVALFAGAYALWNASRFNKSITATIPDFLWLGIVLGLSGIVFYLPFYLSFSSQAGGPLPNLIFPTRGAHLWVMFAPLLIPIFCFITYLLFRQKDRRALIQGFKVTIVFVLFMLIMALLMGLAIILLPGLGDFYQNFLGSQDTAAIFQASLTRRLASPGGWITLISLLGLSMAALLGLQQQSPGLTESEHLEDDENIPTQNPNRFTLPPSHGFAILLILLGTLMVLGPEFFYLRDQFGWRMNTIFKFYYQAWLLWGIAAAYGSIVLLRNLRGGWGTAFRIGLTFLLAASLVYPSLSLWEKTNNFQVAEPSLDSSLYLQRDDPDSWQAILWLENAPPGVVAEAVPGAGGSYTQYGRMATFSGIPNLLGWVGHESQWRGGGEAMGDRQQDLTRLYCSRDWSEAQSILDKYEIRYIVVGPLERSAYGPDANYCPAGMVEAKFLRNLTPVFQNPNVTIYEYSESN